MFQSLLYWISHCGISHATVEFFEELFQSLLYWISHCGRGIPFSGVVYLAFQSLLYWISHCGKMKKRSCVLTPAVSILVVLD